jgi:transcription antitermination factor NusG
MDWNETTAHLIKKTRNVWGVLLQPVVTGHHIKISVTKPTRQMADDLGGWAAAAEECVRRGARWRVVTPDGGTVVAKGKARDRAEAQAAAEKAKAKAEEFKPTAVKSREAAELLIAQKAVNQICKDKEEKDKAVVNLRVDDRVNVIAGVWRGQRGTVRKVNRLSKTDVTVDIAINMLGREVVVTLNHHDVKRTTTGDRD